MEETSDSVRDGHSPVFSAEARTLRLRSARLSLDWILEGGRLQLRQVSLGDDGFLNPTLAKWAKAGESWPRRGYLTDAAPPADPVVVPAEATERDASETGNPLLLALTDGPGAGEILGMRDFDAEILEANEKALRVRLARSRIGLTLEMRVAMENGLAIWSLDATSETDREIEAAFPLFARVCAGSPADDTVYVPQVSGCALKNLLEEEYRAACMGRHGAPYYIGQIASPFLIFQGEERGIFLIDENARDRDPEADSLSRRSLVVAARHVLPGLPDDAPHVGPAVGISHRAALKAGVPFPLGPVALGAHRGGWKAAGMFIRQRRRAAISLAPLPASFRTTTLLSEYNMERHIGKEGFSALAGAAYDESLKRGADLFHIIGYNRDDGERIGENWLNRGDYLCIAENLGGANAFREAVAALHRRGGRVLPYVELLIVWKKSELGRSADAPRWALTERDGAFTEHYEGFWHMCPACGDYQEWIAGVCAELIRRYDVDGFFVDSSAATYFHRCFNPAHRHPTPDVWNRGIYESFRRIAEECRKVRSDIVILGEGCADLARANAHGFVAHSHEWTRWRFEAPVTRFVHPEMRAFESWGSDPERAAKAHLLNFATGQVIYAHWPLGDEMAPFARRTRMLHEAYPEIPNGEMIPEDVRSDRPQVVAHAFGTPMRAVLAVANLSPDPVQATLWVPGAGSLLYDRLEGAHVPLAGGLAWLDLPGYSQFAYELR
jgi:hypothetical protein